MPEAAEELVLAALIHVEVRAVVADRPGTDDLDSDAVLLSLFGPQVEVAQGHRGTRERELSALREHDVEAMVARHRLEE